MPYYSFKFQVEANHLQNYSFDFYVFCIQTVLINHKQYIGTYRFMGLIVNYIKVSGVK